MEFTIMFYDNLKKTGKEIDDKDTETIISNKLHVIRCCVTVFMDN